MVSTASSSSTVIDPSPSRSYILKEKRSLFSLEFVLFFAFVRLSGRKNERTLTKSWNSSLSSLPWKKAWMMRSPRGLIVSSGILRKSCLCRNPFLHVELAEPGVQPVDLSGAESCLLLDRPDLLWLQADPQAAPVTHVLLPM